MEYKLSIKGLLGGGYDNGWFENCHCRYRLFKGARNTKKSINILGFEVLFKIMMDKRRNVLIIRNTNTSNRDSTFATLLRIINQPDMNTPEINLSRYFKVNRNEMLITYIPTGQVIMFRGCDDVQKIQGIRVVHGWLTDVYFEEAFEIKSYQEFRVIDGTFRKGKDMPNDLDIQLTLCFNAWNKDHWLYTEFFKGRLEDDYNYLETHDYQDFKDEEMFFGFGKGVYLHTSTYKINEFRDKAVYDMAMQQLKENALEIFKVEALGMWGNATESTYPEFNDSLIITPQEANNQIYASLIVGIDTGISDGQGKVLYDGEMRLKSAMTMQLIGITSDYSKIVCLDEYFWSNENQQRKKTSPECLKEMTDKIAEWLNYYNRPLIAYVDSADIASRQNLQLLASNSGLGSVAFEPATKMRIQTRVDFIRLIMAFGEFKLSSNCKNLIREIKNSRRGEDGQPREDFDDHAINANEYAWAVVAPRLRRWGQFKVH